jgi:plastocyanin
MAVPALIAGCGGGADGGGYNTSPGTGNNPAPSANTNEITVGMQDFSPSNTTVPKGTTVRWTWNSCSGGGYGGYAGCVKHNVTFDDGSNTASAVQDSGSFTHTFSAAGTFKYHCAIHGATMSGQVIVN